VSVIQLAGTFIASSLFTAFVSRVPIGTSRSGTTRQVASPLIVVCRAAGMLRTATMKVGSPP
jgi:hypothetical protein